MKVWFWCLHCQRTFPLNLPDKAQRDEYGHWLDSPHRCAYKDCDGHIGDIWDWEEVRGHNPQYPETPVEGENYPLYPGEPPSKFKATEFEVGDNEFWCVTLEGAAKLLGQSLMKVKIKVLTGRLTKIPYFGKDLIPLPEIAEMLGHTDRQVLEKAEELEISLTLIGFL